MVSLDISKAYDMSWRYATVKKIKDWKMDGKLLCFIENFMKERTLRVAVENTLSNEAIIEINVVQGAVLSATLFLVAMSEIVKILGYAEDWTILTSHKHAITSENRIQKAIHKITKRADNTGFQISIEKTKSILFSLKNYQQTDQQ
jgi:hypothetical protein